jgi:hypothetical protein
MFLEFDLVFLHIFRVCFESFKFEFKKSMIFKFDHDPAKFWQFKKKTGRIFKPWPVTLIHARQQRDDKNNPR